MRVLITNNSLAEVAGTEVYVRDLALGLLQRGHTPVVYSSRLGPAAAALRSATIPVVDDLRACPWRPDIIHGQHHLETMAALLFFEGVPAVSVCHSWLLWEEAPPRFPRIRRWVAVDQVCRDRLVFEHNIPEERVEVMLNSVDLSRFHSRPPLPETPRRALIFSNYVREGPEVAALRQACRQRDLLLDGLGISMGASHPHPEEILGSYDIVFGKARCALEALAVGCAVVIFDMAGMGPMVTTENLQALRSMNLGIRTQREAITVSNLLRALDGYDPADAAETSRRVRADAGHDLLIDRYLKLYEAVLAEEPAGDEREMQAAGAYLQWILPRLKEVYRLTMERNGLQREVEQLRARLQSPAP